MGETLWVQIAESCVNPQSLTDSFPIRGYHVVDAEVPEPAFYDCEAIQVAES